MLVEGLIQTTIGSASFKGRVFTFSIHGTVLGWITYNGWMINTSSSLDKEAELLELAPLAGFVECSVAFGVCLVEVLTAHV